MSRRIGFPLVSAALLGATAPEALALTEAWPMPTTINPGRHAAGGVARTHGRVVISSPGTSAEGVRVEIRARI